MNETTLSLPGGGFEMLREKDLLENTKNRSRLLELMLWGENFSRTFWWWHMNAEKFLLNKNTIRATEKVRAHLKHRCSMLFEPAS